jgi:glyoxylase-like metal-dependent hydrolase (beta-lactamase superfamily II)
VFNFDSPASPAEALPQQTFATTQKLQANGETLALQHFAPAHTDTDIYVHFQRANVIHLGDTFFNTMYPFIDPSTGGTLSGMIAANEKVLALVDSETKIIPGNGPLGTKADLAKTRDMLVIVQERIQKLKSAGKSIQEAVAAKPLDDLDANWGKGMLNGDTFVQVAYISM